jgi:predicted nuclease with TOPRIM domain
VTPTGYTTVLLGVLVVLGGIVGGAELATRRRWGEIVRMFDAALAHGGSIDQAIRSIRVEGETQGERLAKLEAETKRLQDELAVVAREVKELKDRTPAAWPPKTHGGG